MPKPPVLAQLDWNEIFEGGLEYEPWLEQAESESNARTIRTLKDDLTLDEPTLAALGQVERPVHVLAIAEDWCPDVIRHVPVLVKMAEACPNLSVRFVSREDRPEVFVRFLTVGGEAIPKFVFLSDKFVECGEWGPMQSGLRELIARGKGCGDVGAARMKVFAAYQAEPGCETVMAELSHRIGIAAAPAP